MAEDKKKKMAVLHRRKILLSEKFQKRERTVKRKNP